jgi:hypothetical protein
MYRSCMLSAKTLSATCYIQTPTIVVSIVLCTFLAAAAAAAATGITCACEHQVSHASQAPHGEGVGALGHCQPSDLS